MEGRDSGQPTILIVKVENANYSMECLLGLARSTHASLFHAMCWFSAFSELPHQFWYLLSGLIFGAWADRESQIV